jgi:hypothetical protein
MAEPIPFLTMNRELQPSTRTGKKYSLPVKIVGNDYVSCWQFTNEEIQQITETGRVWLRVQSKYHPPVSVHTEEPD